MKKKYTVPELEVVMFDLSDVLSGSPTDLIPSQIDKPSLPDNDEDELGL